MLVGLCVVPFFGPGGTQRGTGAIKGALTRGGGGCAPSVPFRRNGELGDNIPISVHRDQVQVPPPTHPPTPNAQRPTHSDDEPHLHRDDRGSPWSFVGGPASLFLVSFSLSTNVGPLTWVVYISGVFVAIPSGVGVALGITSGGINALVRLLLSPKGHVVASPGGRTAS